MENTQPPAWKLMKPRPTQLRPQAQLGLGTPRIFYRPCLDSLGLYSSASTKVQSNSNRADSLKTPRPLLRTSLQTAW